MSLALGSPAEDRPLPTEVRLLWDADYLYIRFTSICETEPYSPFGTTRDAKHYQGDAVEVFLDPVGDGRQYFELQQSPAGGILDQNTLLTAEARYDATGRLVPDLLKRDYWPNLGYEMAGLRNASRVERQGNQYVWIADFALPAKAVLHRMGRDAFAPMSLRLDVLRYHNTGPIEEKTRRLIAMNWKPVTFGCPHQSPGAFGKIELVNETVPAR